jgi:regulator of protease activity HflC (stomatin/prohibitin superfamily)
MLLSLLLVLVIAGALLFVSLKNLPPHERGVIYRLGKPVPGAVGPGLVLMVPFVDRMTRVSIAAETVEAGRATVVYRVADPFRATTEVSDYRSAMMTLARRLIEEEAQNADTGEMAKRVRAQLEEAAQPWGILIQSVNATRFAKP